MRSNVRRLPGRRDSPILKRGYFSFSKIATFHPVFCQQSSSSTTCWPAAYDYDVEELSHNLRATVVHSRHWLELRPDPSQLSASSDTPVRIPVMPLAWLRLPL